MPKKLKINKKAKNLQTFYSLKNAASQKKMLWVPNIYLYGPVMCENEAFLRLPKDFEILLWIQRREETATTQ